MPNLTAPPVVATFLDDALPNTIAIEMRTEHDPDHNLSQVDILLFDEDSEDGYSIFTIANNPSKLRRMAAWLIDAAAWTEKNQGLTP
jgi:hypothetical protein